MFLEDPYRIVIVKLLKCNYDVFVPFQKPYLADELVISDGKSLKRYLVKKAIAGQNGPILHLNVSRDGEAYLVDNLAVDGILCCWPPGDEVWMLPLAEVCLRSSISLRSRDEHLVRPIRRIDQWKTSAAISEAVKQARRGMQEEETIAKDGQDRAEFYRELLSHSHES